MDSNEKKVKRPRIGESRPVSGADPNPEVRNEVSRHNDFNTRQGDEQQQQQGNGYYPNRPYQQNRPYNNNRQQGGYNRYNNGGYQQRQGGYNRYNNNGGYQARQHQHVPAD